MKIVEWIKDHPYIAAGCVFVFGVIVVFGMGGSESETVDGGGAGDALAASYQANAAAANTLAQMQIQGQVASHLSDNDVRAKANDNETAYQLGKANFEYLGNKDVLAAKVATLSVEAQRDVSMLEINQSAAVAKHNANTALAIKAGEYGRDIQVANITAAVQNNKTAAEAQMAKDAAANALAIRNAEIAFQYKELETNSGIAARKNELDFASTNFATLSRSWK